MRKILTIITLLCLAMGAGAQDEPEYRAEVGVAAGLVAYQGDFGGSVFSNMQPAAAFIGRYKFNPRMNLSMNVTYGKLKGSSDNTKTWYPELNDTTIAFSNTLVDVGAHFEYNFWPYGTGREYFGAKPLTPYISLGLGATYAKTDGGSAVTMNLPIGVGVKYKIAQRLNIALQWTIHFTLSDKLDATADPYGIPSGGAFKNTDSYSMLQLSLTYDIMAKCKTCNNDRY